MLDIKGFEASAKLCLTESERAFISDTADMLTESFKELEKINTDGAEALAGVLDVKNVFREDKVIKLLSREELLSGAPESYDGYFSVPGTLV